MPTAKSGGWDVAVEEGEPVEADQVLARIDAGEIEAELRLAHREKSEAAAELARRESDLALATQELGRARILFDRGHASEETLDRRIAAEESARSAVRVAEAEAAVDAASEAIGAAEAQVEFVGRRPMQPVGVITIYPDKAPPFRLRQRNPLLTFYRNRMQAATRCTKAR